MPKTKLNLNENLNNNCNKFVDKIESEMHYQSDLSSDAMDFEWLDEVEFALVYLDNIVRNPKLALIKIEETVKIEKAKKTSVASIKNLSRNTRNIDEIDEKTGDVRPSKILIERSEETYNIYENRFIYTLISNLTRFILLKQELLDNFEIKNDKVLEYAATTVTNEEKVNIELKISANELPKDLNDKSLEKQLEDVKKRMKRVKQFITCWENSEMMKALVKAKVPFVLPPIKKTNVILKNPNFQVAMKLWNYLQSYEEDDTAKDGLDTEGDKILKGILGDAFLMNYFVLDSITKSKREQKNNLVDYAVVMIHQQIKRVVSMLLNSGLKISDEEILELILNEIKKERNNNTVDSSDIKNKFKNAFEEFLEKSQEYL